MFDALGQFFGKLFEKQPHAVRASLAAIPEAQRGPWEALLAHAETAKDGRPTGAWSKEAQRLIDGLGAEAVRTSAREWLSEIGANQAEREGPFLAGLVWMTPLLATPELAREVAAMVERCFKKIPGHGPSSVKAGNAGIWALGAWPTDDGAQQLVHLRTRVGYRHAQGLIERTLGKSAATRGLSRDELEETSAPEPGDDFTRALGRWRPQLRFVEEKLELRWVRDDGKTQTSVPAEVASAHPDEAAALKAELKELRKLMPSQAARLEAFWGSDREVPYLRWQAHYAEHGLVGLLVRALVWSVDGRAAVWLDGELHGVKGDAVTASDTAKVRLWHPLGASEDELAQWRAYFEELKLPQPFPQLRRETFILTEREWATGVIERFAGRDLHQHGLATRCREQGWVYRLQGQFDSANQPVKRFFGGKLVATVGMEVADVATTGAGIFTTVRAGPLSLDVTEGKLSEVPPVVLSEVLREVSDLTRS